MTKINLKPTAGYLLVEPLEKEVKTASGIYIPENVGEKPQKGKVIGIGPSYFQDGREMLSPSKLNQVVLYKKWGTNDVKIDGKDYMFIRFEDVLAVEE
jgi:chaperonin GroES